MDSIVSYEYCLKERIVAAVEYFENTGILKSTVLQGELLNKVSTRKLFFDVDKQISTMNKESNFEEIYNSISDLYSKSKHSQIDIESFWDCIRTIIITNAYLHHSETQKVVDVILMVFDNNTENPEIAQWDRYLKELNTVESLRAEFTDLSKLEERQRQLSNMICSMEEETCGPCILEQRCIPEMRRLIQEAIDFGHPLGLDSSTVEEEEEVQEKHPRAASSDGEDWEPEPKLQSSSLQFPAIPKPVAPPAPAKVKLPKVNYYVPQPVKRRVFWTKDEEDRLTKGVHTYGEGNWVDIRIKMKLTRRTNVEIKDKWRNMKIKALRNRSK